ncbi:hypothetical protein [Ilumatobacter nonamiensis]|uniref:hypothetical protein n=1 Tax=Ilumatobacter nonamiensis TaxID=467093 RepID=UPI000348F65D|nr:hypothetical protein [Ilumatobacter nonamiensis]
MSGRILQRAAIVAAVTLVGGCATTVDDDTADVPDDPAASLSEAELTGGEGRELAEDDTSPLDTGVIVDSAAPAATVPIEGSAADLLPEIGIEMSRLSAEIADDGDEDATIARIEGLWAAIADEVAETHPDLVPAIQTTVDMARNAVDTNRPADGDKAFSILTDLIDDYTGDA